MDDLHLVFSIESANYSLGHGLSLPQKSGRRPARQIIRDVAERHHLSVDDLLSERRTRHLTRPRFEACYELARDTHLSLPQMGRLMGGRDHTTMLHAIRRHCELNGLDYPRARA